MRPGRLEAGILLWMAVWVVLLAGCNLPSSWPSTPEASASPTSAVSRPAASSVPRVTPGSTPAPSAGKATATPTPTHCVNAAAPGSPIDITVPDDTVMRPGQPFTKIWLLVNAGTCTWTPDYRAVWFSGARLGAASGVALGREVPPGQAVTVAVDMVAPLAPGVYQSYWKLRAADGTLFGIGRGAGFPFWARIVVVKAGKPTATPTPTITPPPTATPTPTPTATPTPVVEHQGRATLVPGDGLEVDGRKASATDILYLRAGAAHVLRPQDAARWGIFGSERPSRKDCISSVRSAADIPVDSLPGGTYFCYRSSDGHFGYARLETVDRSNWRITLSFTTWAGQ